MANLRQIKKRLINVSVVEKVTQSMKAISSSNLAYAKAQRYGNQAYFQNTQETINNLFSLYKQSKNSAIKWVNKIFNGTENNINGSKTLLIFIAADRGLCGSYNSSITKAVNNRLLDNKEQIILCPIGKKAQQFANKQHSIEKISYELSSDLKKIELDEFNIFVNYILSAIRKGDINKVEIIYTHSENVLEQNIRDKMVFPVNNKEEEIKNLKKDDDQITNNVVTDEASFEKGIEELIKNYISFMLYDVLSDSMVSEFSSRLNAMNNANDNCKDLKTQLQLEYNITRQSIITRELIEIISGAESI